MRLAVLFGGLILSGSLAGPTSAQQQDVADVIKARQDQMKALGAEFRIINEALKSATPDRAAIAAAGERMAETIKNTNALYPPGTGPESGLATRALAVVWSQHLDFNRSGDSSIAEAAKFRQTAVDGDLDQVKVGFKALTDTCIACHTKFRAEEK